MYKLPLFLGISAQKIDIFIFFKKNLNISCKSGIKICILAFCFEKLN